MHCGPQLVSLSTRLKNKCVRPTPFHHTYLLARCWAKLGRQVIVVDANEAPNEYVRVMLMFCVLQYYIECQRMKFDKSQQHDATARVDTKVNES